MSTLAWVGVIVGSLAVVAGGLLLWRVFDNDADGRERSLRITHYVGSLLLVGALVGGGVVLAYGVTALDEASPRGEPTKTTTKNTTVTEGDPKTTVTEETATEPAATAADQTAMLGALLAFTFGMAALGALLVARDRAPAPTAPSEESEDPTALAEAALYAALHARDAAEAASAPGAPPAERKANVDSAGRAAKLAGQQAAKAVEADLPAGTAVDARIAAWEAERAGEAAVSAAAALQGGPDDAALAAAATAADKATTAAVLAADHVDGATADDEAVVG